MQVPYIARYAATEAVWEILNNLGYSQKHNDRLVEEVEAVLDGYSVVDTQPVYVDKEYVLKCMEDSHKNAGLSTEAKAKMTRWLNRAPSIYAQPIVRCANCKYDNHCLTQEFIEENSVIPFDKTTFYCADGRRLEDGA